MHRVVHWAMHTAYFDGMLQCIAYSDEAQFLTGNMVNPADVF